MPWRYCRRHLNRLPCFNIVMNRRGKRGGQKLIWDCFVDEARVSQLQRHLLVQDETYSVSNVFI